MSEVSVDFWATSPRRRGTRPRRKWRMALPIDRPLTRCAPHSAVLRFSASTSAAIARALAKTGPMSTEFSDAGGAYASEDGTAAAFEFNRRTIGTGIWNFNASEKTDFITFTGAEGELQTPIFSDTDVVLTRGSERRVYELRNPPHVHQPLIQTIVDELRGEGRCASSGESAARTSWVLDRCVESYYDRRPRSG